MSRRTAPLLGAALALFACLSPAYAIDVTEMTPQEREAFHAEIRAYLLENPEVIMEAVAVLEERQKAQRESNDASIIRANAGDIFEDGHSWVGGNPEGDVTVVEFMDYRCGYCRRAFPEVTELVESDGGIRFVVKEFPILGEESVIASRFAVAVKQIEGDAAYKAVHDALMSFKGSVSETPLRRMAGTLGLDTDAIFAHMDSDAVTEVIAANHALARKLGISGTPAFVMDDRMLRGYLPLEDMREVVAEIRAE